MDGWMDGWMDGVMDGVEVNLKRQHYPTSRVGRSLIPTQLGARFSDRRSWGSLGACHITEFFIIRRQRRFAAGQRQFHDSENGSKLSWT